MFFFFFFFFASFFELWFHDVDRLCMLLLNVVWLGIVLTKFDTIDDKVGAAISMTYTTGQPIMFVGCGQTCECRNPNLNASSFSLSSAAVN